MRRGWKFFEVMALVLLWGLAASSGFGKDKTLKVGWTAWSDAEAVTKLAAKVIETNTPYKVKLTMADIGIQYQGISTGDLDFMMMAWLPTAQADYLKKVNNKIINLGPIYTNAKIGWVIPDYIPASELSSIEDLLKDSVRKKLKGSIQGIDPGAGLMKASEKTIAEYGLKGYKLISASGAAMTVALDRAIKRKQWVVVTGWSPHWKFAKYKLRYLEDPKGTLGASERVHTLARKGFYQDHTDVASILSRMYMPLDELQAVMLQADADGYDKAVAAYIKNNPQRVKYWLTGKM